MAKVIQNKLPLFSVITDSIELLTPLFDRRVIENWKQKRIVQNEFSFGENNQGVTEIVAVDRVDKTNSDRRYDEESRTELSSEEIRALLKAWVMYIEDRIKILRDDIRFYQMRNASQDRDNSSKVSDDAIANQKSLGLIVVEKDVEKIWALIRKDVLVANDKVVAQSSIENCLRDLRVLCKV